MISFSVQCTGVDSPTQKLPADFVKSLLENQKGYFVDVDYSNYSVSEVEEQKQTTDPATGQTTVTGTGKKISTVNFSVTVTMKGEKSIYKPEKADEEKTDTETADTENTEGEAE